MEPIELGTDALALVAVIAAIVEQFKRVPALTQATKYAPVFVILSVALGLLGANYLQVANWPIAGVVMGLSASGAYSIVKGAKRQDE